MWKTFAFNNYFNDADRAYPVAEQWDILKSIGYDKTYFSVGRSNEDAWDMFTAIGHHRKRTGLGLAAAYTIVDITDPAPEGTHSVEEMLEYLEKGDTLELVFTCGWKKDCSDPKHDEAILAWLKPLAEKATAQDITIALYHHFGLLTERIEDCVRLAKAIDLPNVKVTFCGYHWFAIDGGDLPGKLKLAEPYLHLVNLSGSDELPEEKRNNPLPKSIKPVGEGDFPLVEMLKLLKKMGYTGDIGFQGFLIGGHPPSTLKQSYDAFKAACHNV